MIINVDVNGLYQFTSSEVDQIKNISPFDLEVCRAVECVLDIVRDTPSEFFPVYILDAFKEACEHHFLAPYVLHCSDLMAAYALFKYGSLDELELYRASNTSLCWYCNSLGSPCASGCLDAGEDCDVIDVDFSDIEGVPF